MFPVIVAANMRCRQKASVQTGKKQQAVEVDTQINRAQAKRVICTELGSASHRVLALFVNVRLNDENCLPLNRITSILKVFIGHKKKTHRKSATQTQVLKVHCVGFSAI